MCCRTVVQESVSLLGGMVAVVIVWGGGRVSLSGEGVCVCVCVVLCEGKKKSWRRADDGNPADHLRAHCHLSSWCLMLGDPLLDFSVHPKPS